MKTLLLSIALPLAAQPCFGMFREDGMISKGDTQTDVLKRCDHRDYLTSSGFRHVETRGHHVDARRTTVVTISARGGSSIRPPSRVAA